MFAALSTFAAALGTGVAAVAAWRAAKASLDIGENAREALALGIRPEVALTRREYGDGRIMIRVVAHGAWPASDLELVVKDSGGRTTLREHRDFLEGHGDLMQDVGPSWTVLLAEVSEQWPKHIDREHFGGAIPGAPVPPGDDLAISVSYSDSRRFRRDRISERWRFWQVDGKVGSTILEARDEVRLS